MPRQQQNIREVVEFLSRQETEQAPSKITESLIKQVQQVNTIKSQLAMIDKVDPEIRNIALVEMGLKPQEPRPESQLSNLLAVNPFGRKRRTGDALKISQY